MHAQDRPAAQAPEASVAGLLCSVYRSHFEPTKVLHHSLQRRLGSDARVLGQPESHSCSTD